MEKIVKILDPNDEESIRERTSFVFEVIRGLLKKGQTVVVEIDSGPRCPSCNGPVTIDAGDMFRNQYGKTYRCCTSCMTCFPEEQ
jgi:hypothetical protein